MLRTRTIWSLLREFSPISVHQPRLQSGDTVVCANLGYMFRNHREALNIVEDFRLRGIRLVLLDLNVDTCRPKCEQFVALIADLAEWEHLRISEWTTEGLDWRKAQGLPYAPNCAVGWRIVKSRFVDGKKRYAPDYKRMAYGYAVMLLRDRYKVPIDALALASHIAGKENAQGGLIRRWDSAARLDFPRDDGTTPFRVPETKAAVIQAAEELAAKLLAEVLRRRGHWAKRHLRGLSQATA